MCLTQTRINFTATLASVTLFQLLLFSADTKNAETMQRMKLRENLSTGQDQVICFACELMSVTF